MAEINTLKAIFFQLLKKKKIEKLKNTNRQTQDSHEVYAFSHSYLGQFHKLDASRNLL